MLWKMGFSAAKIAPPPPYTPPGTIDMRKGFVPQFAMVVLLRLAACNTPLLIGLTTAYFRHWRRPSCAPLALSLGFFDRL